MSEYELVAQSWLRYAYSWLNCFEKNGTLSDPANLLLARLENKRRENDSKSVWDIINDLKRLSDKSDDKESAEIKLRCGLIAAEMDNFHNALRLFSEASSKYTSFKHHRAVALWMIGCVQWLLPKREVDAINSWRTSMKGFESLRDHNKITKNDYEWYENRCDEMRNALHVAAETYKIPPLPENTVEWSKNDDSINSLSLSKILDKTLKESSPIAQTDSSVKDESFSWGRLRLIPVYGQIAAGDFGASGVLAQPASRLEINQVLIEDVPYRIHSLVGGQVINLPSPQEHFVLKVSGNSMNLARPMPIENNDYVLMRRQAAADNGNIVAAEIIHEDPKATLKRYRFQAGQYVLQPESADLNFKEQILMKNDFFIRGIALAVLKKL
jgi:hypothetical protein